jgi:hypothetical protein
MQLSALQLRELPVFEPERLAKQSRALRDTVAGDRVFFGLGNFYWAAKRTSRTGDREDA